MSSPLSDPDETFGDSEDYWRAAEFEGWPVMDLDPWRVSTQPTEPIMKEDVDHE